MLYGTPQSGYNGPPNQGLNLASVPPGESYILFSGTETPSSGVKSVAIARGYSPGAVDDGMTFYCSGMPAGCTIDVQASNTDLDGDYLTLATLSGDANGNAGYTDTGRAAFYRAKISAFTTGAMPIVTVNR